MAFNPATLTSKRSPHLAAPRSPRFRTGSITSRSPSRISIIVAAELRYGCARSGSARLTKAVEDILGEIAVLPFDAPADAEYGDIRSEPEAAGKPIGGNDLLIAAHASALGATIVTADTGEFGRVRGLRVVNWLDGRDVKPSFQTLVSKKGFFCRADARLMGSLPIALRRDAGNDTLLEVIRGCG